MKRLVRAMVAVGIAAVLPLSFAGCGRGASTAGGQSASQAGKPVTLALSTLNNPFFVDVRDGATAAAQSAGITLNVVDAQNDAATQANQIQTAVAAKAAGIIINAVDSDAAGAAVKPALDAKLPVVAVDRAVNGATVTSFIASDNVAGGKQGADALAKAIGNKGKIIVLQGTVGTSASRDRGQGFSEGLKNYPDIQVVAEQTANFDRTQGLDVATNLLQAHPDIVGIFAENDEMALGALQALGDKAGKSVFVVGFDGTADGLTAVKNGTMYATIAQQPKELGKAAVNAMAQALNGQSVAATQPVPVQTVTAANVSDFLK